MLLESRIQGKTIKRHFEDRRQMNQQTKKLLEKLKIMETTERLFKSKR